MCRFEFRTRIGEGDLGPEQAAIFTSALRELSDGGPSPFRFGEVTLDPRYVAEDVIRPNHSVGFYADGESEVYERHIGSARTLSFDALGGNFHTFLGYTRFKTHGENTPENAQPLRTRRLVVVHNGTLALNVPEGMSDSRYLTEQLEERLPAMPSGQEVIQTLEHMVSKGSSRNITKNLLIYYPATRVVDVVTHYSDEVDTAGNMPIKRHEYYTMHYAHQDGVLHISSTPWSKDAMPMKNGTLMRFDLFTGHTRTHKLTY